MTFSERCRHAMKWRSIQCILISIRIEISIKIFFSYLKFLYTIDLTLLLIFILLDVHLQVGLCYAISQGVLAKLFIKMSGEDPTIVLLICVAGLSVGRVFAMLTTSIVMVYIIMACVIVALGVMNTAMASACSRLADADQV